MIPDSLYAVANHLWQSTLFAGVAGLLTLALRSNSARLRFWIWMSASVKFLIPLYLFVALGSHFGLRSTPATRPPVMTVVIEEISQTFTPVAQSAPLHVRAAPVLSRVLAILTGVWALGLVVVGASFWSRRRRVKAAVRAGSPVQFETAVPVMSSPALLEPGVFGIFRPVLLLPQGITDRLTPEQLDAIVAHELCHLRRRDNLTAALHMLVETIFWFHCGGSGFGLQKNGSGPAMKKYCD
jgi:bla regulator protein blaR1